MTLPKWLRWPVRLTPALFNPNVSVTQFKSDSGRVSALAELLRTPVFRSAWSVVMTLAPPHRDYADPNHALHDMGVVRGMRRAHEALQFLALPDEKTEPIEMDWGAETPDETKG